MISAPVSRLGAKKAKAAGGTAPGLETKTRDEPAPIVDKVSKTTLAWSWLTQPARALCAPGVDAAADVGCGRSALSDPAGRSHRGANQ